MMFYRAVPGGNRAVPRVSRPVAGGNGSVQRDSESVAGGSGSVQRDGRAVQGGSGCVAGGSQFCISRPVIKVVSNGVEKLIETGFEFFAGQCQAV